MIAWDHCWKSVWITTGRLYN